MKNSELVADIYEALEALRRWKPVYLAALRHTKDKQQALDAIKYLLKIEREMPE